jgi:hypothetical protein
MTGMADDDQVGALFARELDDPLSGMSPQQFEMDLPFMMLGFICGFSSDALKVLVSGLLGLVNLAPHCNVLGKRLFNADYRDRNRSRNKLKRGRQSGPAGWRAIDADDYFAKFHFASHPSCDSAGTGSGEADAAIWSASRCASRSGLKNCCAIKVGTNALNMTTVRRIAYWEESITP